MSLPLEILRSKVNKMNRYLLTEDRKAIGTYLTKEEAMTALVERNRDPNGHFGLLRDENPPSNYIEVLVGYGWMSKIDSLDVLEEGPLVHTSVYCIIDTTFKDKQCINNH